MTEPRNPDELLEAQKEIRHLKETVIALRDEMEMERAERDDLIEISLPVCNTSEAIEILTKVSEQLHSTREFLIEMCDF